MPLLGDRWSDLDATEEWGSLDQQSRAQQSRAQRLTPLFPECANPRCGSGRLRLWRSRRTPAIEGGWVCSPACALARMQKAVSRELAGHARIAETHRHRVPLGLILLTQGWITHEQLKKALLAQRQGAPERIGTWLMRHCDLDEQRVTQALSLQWSCPVFSGEPDPALFSCSPVPRILLDTFGVVPLRISSSGSLYVAFEDRVDHSLVLAIEKMTGRRVEAGLLSGSEFRGSHQRMLSATFPRARLMEAVSAEALAEALTRVVEKFQPAESRLVRVHHLFWLRLWKEQKNPDIESGPVGSGIPEDIVCSIGNFE